MMQPKVSRLRPFAAAALLALLLLAVGCAGGLKPESFAGAEPRFDPLQFFDGPTRSWGVLESRSGKPKSRFKTDLMGRREGEDLVITQDFTFEDGHRQQRVWRVHRVDDHHYDATANDVVGVSHGLAYGNTFRWEYTVGKGNPFTRLQYKLWMYLQADGETLINRVAITKLGVILAQTTEHFHRGAGPVPSIQASPR
jgi:Protein of unknown function (DUF3833)